MPRYSVRYLSKGRISQSDIEAAGEQFVTAALSEAQGHAITSMDILRAEALPSQTVARSARASTDLVGGTRPSNGMSRHGFPLRLFCQELAVLLDAGIPLLEALVTLREKEAAPYVAQVLSSVIESLSHGQTLAQAMRAHPQAFSSLLIASIEASQRTGQSPEALRQHAAYLAWLGGLRDKLVSAAIYPAILIAASLLVIAFLTVFVVPRFADIYEGMGGELPWLSDLLLRTGKSVGAHPLPFLAGLCTVVAAISMAWRAPSVRALLAERLWRLPYVGERMRLVELAALYRTLGLLLQSGVTVVAALESSAELVGAALRPALALATQRVRDGARLSDSLHEHGLSTPVSLRMVRVGERTGQLGPMLERAATFYDEDLARFTEWVGKVVSPALMLIMGVLIGGIVVLMYLPIFQVAEQIQ